VKFSEFDIKARYRKAYKETGAGCTQWAIDLPEGNGAHILITGVDDCNVPEPEDTVVHCGTYPTADGDVWRFLGTVAVKDLASWIDATITDSANRRAAKRKRAKRGGKR
jgi:hypothetical protein